MICPVTLGDALAEDKDSGAIAPEWVHAPVLFAYLEYVSRLEAEYTEAKNTAHYDRAEKSGNMFLRWINSEEIETLDSLLSDLHKRLDLYRSRINIVKQAMPEDLIIIRNGREGNR